MVSYSHITVQPSWQCDTISITPSEASCPPAVAPHCPCSKHVPSVWACSFWTFLRMQPYNMCPFCLAFSTLAFSFSFFFFQESHKLQNVLTSFLQRNNTPLRRQAAPSSPSQQLMTCGWFALWAITHSAVVNICGWLMWEHMFSFVLGAECQVTQ